MQTLGIRRRDFIAGAAAFAAARGRAEDAAARQRRLVDKWEEATCLVAPADYARYMHDGDTRGLIALKAAELAFDRVLKAAKSTIVAGDAPAVWSVYNMGYVVKTRKSLFAIDLKHRRAAEFAPLLDFALVTHVHGDHWSKNFCSAMDSAGKTVVSHFLENKGASLCGFSPGERTLTVNDVEIRTFRVDHAPEKWGIDFTTAFEMRIGDFRLLHTGDCSPANDKLRVKWGRPDLWLFFPMGRIDVADALRRVDPKRCVLGHLWELSHGIDKGRARKSHIERALSMAGPWRDKTSVAFWGDRII